MKLTTKTEYSLLSLIYLARHPEKEFIKIDDICCYYDIPKKYLQQLFNILRAHQIVKTKAGNKGGYSLAKNDTQIRLADIIRIMDGPLAATESVSTYFFSHNKFEKEKKVISVFKELRDYIANRLENLTLRDLI